MALQNQEIQVEIIKITKIYSISVDLALLGLMNGNIFQTKGFGKKFLIRKVILVYNDKYLYAVIMDYACLVK